MNVTFSTYNNLITSKPMLKLYHLTAVFVDNMRVSHQTGIEETKLEKQKMDVRRLQKST